MQALPIDAILPDLVRTITHSRALVLETPPGAGKTTRAPWALLESELGKTGEILVAEPRRIAARMAARRVADERGQRLGQRVGYSVRFEEVSGPDTRLRYLTEGVLLRRLLRDPELGGVSAVVLDEFHERHLATDLLLVLLSRLKKTSRPDLALLVMSATLDAEPVARFLGDCPRVRSEGRMFDVTIEHLPKPDDRPLEKQVASAVRSATDADPEGDVLVFLPGAAEIRRAQETLTGLSRERDLSILPLHGDLPLADQVRAVERAGKRKVVLATNVAESSLTIDGVTAVIDSGLARVAGFSPWTGLPTLITEKISKASARQRAGRAGRTREGRVFRLYTRSDFETRPEHDLPELRRADLCEALLVLHGAGVAAPGDLEWLDAPPAASVAGAEELLTLLGALDDGKLSAIGRRLLDFPVHPRLARVIVEGERRGVADEACLVAALLGERDLRLEARAGFGDGRRAGPAGASGPSDLLELIERFREAEAAGFEPSSLRAQGLDVRATQAVRSAYRQLARQSRDRAERPAGLEAVDQAILRSILAGFADRVARRKKRGERELSLVGGGAARLSEQSVVHDAMLMVAVDVEDHTRRAEPGRGGAIVRLASAIEPDWLLEDFPGRITLSDELVWNAERERVERLERMSFGSIPLEESATPAAPSEQASALLLAAAKSDGQVLRASDALTALSVRLALVREHVPSAGLPELGSDGLEAALALACRTLVSFAELRSLDLGELFAQNLSFEQRRLLDEWAPERVVLPGGRAVKVHYEAGKPPWIESRLQDFFGMSQGPAICAGRVPLTLHLLAPNQRAVQVTSDLAGFWERHYPAIRRELMRRYPRHSWPEDGRTARPPEPRRR